MTLKHDVKPEVRTPDLQRPEPSGLRKVTEQLSGIFGAVALLVGLLIAYGGEDQYLGIGDWAWRIGDIDTGWMYGFLIGGAVLLIASATLIWQRLRTRR